MDTFVNSQQAPIEPPCPCCGSRDTLRVGERRIGKMDGRAYDLRNCVKCTSTVSYADLVDVLNSGESEREQEEGARSFYNSSDITAAEVAKHIADDRRVEFLIWHYPVVPRGTFCDFGAGAGYVAGSALNYFERAIAVDLCTDILEQTVPLFPSPHRVNIARQLPRHENIDVLCLFHVIEHMPNMYETLSPLVEQLSGGGALFFQVPLLKSEYLTRTHYTYLNEYAASVLCERLGLKIVGVWFDNGNDFMTAIASKPRTPAPQLKVFNFNPARLAASATSKIRAWKGRSFSLTKRTSSVY